MYTYFPTGAQTLVLTDVCTRADAEAMDATKQPCVLRWWKPGNHVWGSKWSSVARAALFVPGVPITPNMRAQAKQELQALLTSTQMSSVQRIVVLQTQSASARKVYNEDEADAEHGATLCWDFFDPPASIRETAGCLYQTPYGIVIPVLNPRNVDYVYGVPIAEWLRWAKEAYPAIVPTKQLTEPSLEMRRELESYRDRARQGWPLALDIESLPGTGHITVVGLSDGESSVSLPWDGFTAHDTGVHVEGCSRTGLGGLMRTVCKEATTIIGHNVLDHDIPLLRAQGLEFRGEVFDTWIASGVCMPQFRHGLQQCVSYELPVPPWKEMFRAAQQQGTGLKSWQPPYWACRFSKLLEYNGSDAFYNHALGLIYYPRIYGRQL